MSTMNSIIKERRNALGITQKELADRLSISDKTVSRWESGNQMPDAILLPDLAEALDISINELYGIKTEANKPTSEVLSAESPYKNSKVLNICYKISMAIGFVLFIFGSMVLVHVNTIRAFNPENGERTYGNVFTYVGLILCIGAQIAYMIICRKKSFNSPIHIKNEIVYGGVSSLGILALLLVVFPYCITVPVSYFYELAAAILATATMVMFFLQKQSLRKAGIKITKAISKISVVILTLCIIIFIGVWVYFTFIYKFEINATDEKQRQLLELLYKLSGQTDLEHKTVWYSFIVLALPLLSAPLMNFIHLMVKSQKLK